MDLERAASDGTPLPMGTRQQPCGAERGEGGHYGWEILMAAVGLDICTAPAHSTGGNVYLDQVGSCFRT